jgi:hypothetical protein
MSVMAAFFYVFLVKQFYDRFGLVAFLALQVLISTLSHPLLFAYF